MMVTREQSAFNAKGIPFDVKYHPSDSIIAVATIEGLLSLHMHSGEEKYSDILFHDSIRSIDFHPSYSELILMGSKDKSFKLLDVISEKVVVEQQKAHKNPINKVMHINDTILCTGDDQGTVHIWDIRAQSKIRSYSDGIDYISDFVFEKDKLLVTSGDGCLSVYDLQYKKPIKVSDNQDDELSCISTARNCTKAVVGTQSGVILLFSWDNFGDSTDRFPCHPESINCMVKVKDNVFITGSGDGIIRCINVLPNKLIGNVAISSDSIEALDISPCGKYLVSCSLGETIKVWNCDMDESYANLTKPANDSDSDDSITGPKLKSLCNGFYEDLD